MLLRVVLNVMLLPATAASTAEPEKAPLTLDEKKKKASSDGGRGEKSEPSDVSYFQPRSASYYSHAVVLYSKRMHIFIRFNGI